MKIVSNQNYQDGSKQQFIYDLNVAFAEGATERIMSMFTEDIVWNMVGDGTAVGKEAVQKRIDGMDFDAADELVIDAIIHDGDAASASGEMVFKDSKIAFCDVYRLSEVDGHLLVGQMTSYAVALD